MPEENPYVPRLEGPPVPLTFDGRSLSNLQGEQWREFNFLLSLTHTPLVEAAVLDADEHFAPDLRHWYLADPDRELDHRLVKEAGSERGFVGGVTPWASREKRADANGLAGSEREWFLYYEAATEFHRRSSQHFYVTEDPAVLSQVEAGGSWAGRRTIPVRRALQLVGLVMRGRESLYLDARPGYLSTASNYDFYFYLGHALAPTRVRLHQWQEEAPVDSRPVLLDLEQSIAARVMDLLKARDGIALQWLRHQNNATLDEMLYHLRVAVLTAGALFDSIAVFAATALDIEADDMSRVSLHNKKFRPILRTSGAERLAEAAGKCGPLWKLLREIRNPVSHGTGLSGVGYTSLPGHGARESRLTLRREQAEAVLSTAQWAGEDPDVWGVSPRDGWAHDSSSMAALVEMLAFSHHFVALSIRTADSLVAALADDLLAPPLDRQMPGDWIEKVWKYGLLGGWAKDLTAISAPGWSNV